MTTDYKLPIRSATLYLTPQTYRWLSWIASMEEGVMANADSVAEFMIRRAILAEHPGIEAAEADYKSARKKLDDRAKEMLRSSHAKLDEGRSESV
jgi:hypothetical protein